MEGKLTTNQSYRLPLDWEWSVAVGLNEARDGTPFGKNIKIKNAYLWSQQWPPPKGAGNYSPALQIDAFEYTSPVGSFAANQFGLFDMGGNVWQWCEDFYYGQSGDRVLRGSSWFEKGPIVLLSSYRNFSLPANSNNIFGFRCVLVVGSSR